MGEGFKGFRLVKGGSDSSEGDEPVDEPEDDSGLDELDMESEESDWDIDWAKESRVSTSGRVIRKFGSLGGLTQQLFADIMEDPKKYEVEGTTLRDMYFGIKYIFENGAVVYFEANGPKVQLPEFYEPTAFAMDTKTGMYYVVGREVSGGYHNLTAEKKELQGKIENPSLGFSIGSTVLLGSLGRMRARALQVLEAKIQEQILDDHRLFVLQARVPAEYVYSKFQSVGELGVSAEFLNDYGEGTIRVQGTQVTQLTVNEEPRTVETLPFEDMRIVYK